MNFNKCARCGSFYTTSNNVCPNCETKDTCEQLKLKTFLEENENPLSIENLATDTGISTKNINRYLANTDFNITL